MSLIDGRMPDWLGGVGLDDWPRLLRDLAADRRVRAPKRGQKEALGMEAIASALEQLTPAEREELQGIVDRLVDDVKAFWTFAEPRVSSATRAAAALLEVKQDAA